MYFKCKGISELAFPQVWPKAIIYLGLSVLKKLVWPVNVGFRLG
jgi:hypothetical protein